MADKSDEILSRLFGVPNYKLTIPQTGALIGGSLLATQYLQNNPIDNTLNKIFGIKSFGDISRKTTANVLGVSNELNNELESISNDTMASVKSHSAQVQDSIKSSATARGLDAKVAQESASEFGASTSGAYAAAHKALLEAQTKATANMSGALSNYYQGLAKQQFANKLQEAADNAGIIGSITGIASAIMANANMQAETNQYDITKGKNPYGSSVYKEPQQLEYKGKEPPISRLDLSRESPFTAFGLNPIQQGGA